MVEKTFFSETLKIAAPRKFVFDFLADFNKNVKWIEGLRDEEVVFDEGKVIGAKIKESVMVHGHVWKYEGEVVDYKEGKYLKIHLGDKKEVITLDYTLTDGDHMDTLLTETATVIEGSLLHRWITGFEKYTLQKRLAKFKEVVEDEYKKKETA